MSFQELLIVTVQGYQELYDTRNRHYSNQQRREEIWREIAEVTGESGKYIFCINIFIYLFIYYYPKSDYRYIFICYIYCIRRPRRTAFNCQSTLPFSDVK